MNELTFSRATFASDVDHLIEVRETYPLSDSQREQARNRYLVEIDETENRIVYVARNKENDVVAYGQLILRNADNDPELADGATIGHVHDLRVRAHLQSNGLGGQFMRFLEKQAADLGIQWLTLGVDSWNERALSLYKKLGYEKFKEVDGRTDDEKCIYMRRRLSVFSFPDIQLQSGPVANTLKSFEVTSLHQAVMWVWKLPYGRNSVRSDFMLVPKEARGACSTKHAFLAKLAQEQGLKMDLTVGVFMMNSINTPAISDVLNHSRIDAIPEAHCYLKYRDQRYDFTSYESESTPEPKIEFLYEELITPEQIGDYKVAIHQKWIRSWLSSKASLNLKFEDVWSIREACIHQLAIG